MKNTLTIELFGDVEYEGMVIRVSYNMETVASINYDKGIDRMEVEISPTSKSFVLPLDDFFDVLEKAKNLALKCAKEDEELRKKGIYF